MFTSTTPSTRAQHGPPQCLVQQVARNHARQTQLAMRHRRIHREAFTTHQATLPARSAHLLRQRHTRRGVAQLRTFVGANKTAQVCRHERGSARRPARGGQRARDHRDRRAVRADVRRERGAHTPLWPKQAHARTWGTTTGPSVLASAWWGPLCLLVLRPLGRPPSCSAVPCRAQFRTRSIRRLSRAIARLIIALQAELHKHRDAFVWSLNEVRRGAARRGMARHGAAWRAPSPALAVQRRIASVARSAAHDATR